MPPTPPPLYSPSLIPSPLVTSRLFSVFVSLHFCYILYLVVFLDSISDIIQYLSISVWVILLHSIPSMLLQMSIFHSFYGATSFYAFLANGTATARMTWLPGSVSISARTQKNTKSSSSSPMGSVSLKLSLEPVLSRPYFLANWTFWAHLQPHRTHLSPSSHIYPCPALSARTLRELRDKHNFTSGWFYFHS